MIDIQIVGIDAVIDRLQHAAARAETDLDDTVAAETAILAEAVKDRMAVLFANPRKMQESIGQEMTSSSGAVVGKVFVSGLPYLGIQEFGGVTGPHDIFPVNAKVLAFMGGGQSGLGGGGMVFTRHVHHPGSHLPARSYLRSALDQRRAAIIAAMRHAAASAVVEA